jgi:hypothetical protein
MQRCFTSGWQRTAVEKDWERGCELAKRGTVTCTLNDAHLWRKIRAGDAEIATRNRTDDKLVAQDVEANGRRSPVANLNANRRRGRVRSLLGAGWHVRAVLRGIRTTAKGEFEHAGRKLTRRVF